MTEFLMKTENQLVICLFWIVSLISFLWGHKLGHREGYEDGLRTLAKTMKLNQVRLSLEKDEDIC